MTARAHPPTRSPATRGPSTPRGAAGRTFLGELEAAATDLVNGDSQRTVAKRIADLCAPLLNGDGRKPNELELTARLSALNETYALVLVGDRAAVLQESPGPDGRPQSVFLSTTAFHEWLRPETFYSVEARRKAPLSKLWLEWPDRRQFTGIVFDPSGKAPKIYHNLWRGFAVAPDPRGEKGCRRFIDHVAENVCSGDEQLFNWVMGWFAQMIQQPTSRLGTSLVLRGPQGAGKSIVGATIGSILDPHYESVSEARYLVGRFNSHLARCLLLQLEEVTWGGDHAAAAKLRDLITNGSQLIEYKGKEPVRVRNYLRVMATGNSRWLVPAGLEERRFAVIDVGERQLQNSRYFAAIAKELEDGGRAALLHYLLHFPLDGVPLRDIPETPALVEQKSASLSPEQKWWLDILVRGELPGDVAGGGQIPTRRLQDHYLEHVQRMGVQRKSSETELGMWLRSVAPGLTRKKITVLAAGKSERVPGYVFPPLAECRRVFDRLIAGDAAWFDTSSGHWQPSSSDSS